MIRKWLIDNGARAEWVGVSVMLVTWVASFVAFALRQRALSTALVVVASMAPTLYIAIRAVVTRSPWLGALGVALGMLGTAVYLADVISWHLGLNAIALLPEVPVIYVLYRRPVVDAPADPLPIVARQPEPEGETRPHVTASDRNFRYMPPPPVVDAPPDPPPVVARRAAPESESSPRPTVSEPPFRYQPPPKD